LKELIEISGIFTIVSFPIKFGSMKQLLYRVYQKNRNLGISQEIDIVLKTKDFRRLGI
jgi:hypothetical protein